LNQVEFCQGFLQAGPYRTRYLHAGDESKPVLMMLHGITGHAEAYVRNLRAHAEHFSCWAIDFIGHGYSSKPDHPVEIPHYIDQVSHVLDTLGTQKAYFDPSWERVKARLEWLMADPSMVTDDLIRPDK
jgi:2-hydroxy-6-oxonona-2,4-dienedioate hydrolase